jgi:citrate lyase subunit beta/citryl-CoA lyase
MDTEGLKAYIQQSKQLGFDGMGCIHPRQIRWIHEGYAPTSDQITQADAIVEAYKQAKAKGLGVVALGTKMIDMPVVKRAKNLLAAAQARGLFNPERKEN